MALDGGDARAALPIAAFKKIYQVEAVRQDDREAIRAALVRIGAKDPGAKKAYQVTRGLLRAFYAPVLEPGARRVSAGISHSMKKIVASKRSIMRLHLPGRLLFLFRIRFGLYAVLARLGAELDLSVLEENLADSIVRP